MSTDPTASNASASETAVKPKWRPVPAIERRILGVLVEKAKTVPESYPMTLNGICTGCNQKNNRYPLMSLEPDQLDDPLERLRNYGAVSLVQGSGRTEKFRHYLSEWFGVDKFELAVMTELLLRGAQTEGELRQRASRMEQIADLSALRTILQNLEQRGLVISLTSEGRGHVVTHNLYEQRELEKVRREFEATVPPGGADEDDDDSPRPTNAAGPRPPQVGSVRQSAGGDELEALRDEFAKLKAEVLALRDELEELKSTR
ncbi:MAG: DUF480 domain-containing protein [Pirellula sp.]|nr:DUF480 domain-containing protein [Pirellula sp.]